MLDECHSIIIKYEGYHVLDHPQSPPHNAMAFNGGRGWESRDWNEVPRQSCDRSRAKLQATPPWALFPSLDLLITFLSLPTSFALPASPAARAVSSLALDLALFCRAPLHRTRTPPGQLGVPRVVPAPLTFVFGIVPSPPLATSPPGRILLLQYPRGSPTLTFIGFSAIRAN